MRGRLATEYSGHDGIIKRCMRNMYYEPTPNGDNPFVLYQRGGLVKVDQLGAGPIRDSFRWQGHRIVVSGTDVFFDSIHIGNIPGDDLCRHAFSDDEVVIISAGLAWYITSVSVTQIVDPDIFPVLTDVLVAAGRFLYFNATNGQFQWSEVGDAQNIDGASFATADENSSHVLVAAANLVDDIVMFLDGAAEWWSPTTDITAPFQRSPGRRYNKGIAARNTTVFLDNTIFYLGSDKQIYRASSVPVRVSNFDIEDLIEDVSDVDLPSCSAFGVVKGGHTFYVLNLVGKGTWAFDVASGKWAEWVTWGKDRFRITVGDVDLLGDFYSGNIYQLDKTVCQDDGDPLERVVTGHVPVAVASIPNFNLWLDATGGVGNPVDPASAPVVEMRFSDNDGYDYSNWMVAPLGAIGRRDDTSKAIWVMLGAIRAPGRMYQFRCTDPAIFAPSGIRVNEARL